MGRLAQAPLFRELQITPKARISTLGGVQHRRPRHIAASMTRRRSGGDAGAPREEVVALLDRFADSLPRLVVLDLDYTCWPFWCEVMRTSDTPHLYPDVPAILDGLQEKGVKVAVASRTPTPHIANAFIDKLGLRHRFCSLQLIPAANGFDGHSAMKDKAHLPRIQQQTGLPYSEMLFFDDEHKNVQRVSRLGVVSILVDTASGLCLQSLERGLQQFREAKQRAADALSRHD